MARQKYPSQAIGKRLKAAETVTIFERFPGSDDIQTLPAGKPSPKITGYIPKGFWVLESGEPDLKLYVKDVPELKVVDPGAPDESGIFSGVTAGISDFFSNAAKDVTKQSGFLQEGFKKGVNKTFSDIGGGLIDIKGFLMPLLLAVGGILVLILILKKS